METGWPPRELFVSVITIMETRVAPSSRSLSSRARRSMSPLKSPGEAKSSASGTGRSIASAPDASTLARVVSKWEFESTTLPLPPATENKTLSAARP